MLWQFLLTLFAFGGWLVAAVLYGLYVGERGRRLDAQRREGVIAVDRVKPATVREADLSVSESTRVETEDAKERYVEGVMAEGYTRKEAEQDWDEMMHRSGSDQLGVTL